MWEGVGDWTKTAIYWPPLLWLSALCLSRSPGRLNRRPRGPLCWVRAFSTASCHQRVSKLHRGSRGPFLLSGGFPYHILSPNRLISNSSNLQLNRGSRGPPPPGGGFLYHILTPLLWSPTHWLPVFTELYNSSIAFSIALSIFGMARLIVIKQK